ncbi:MAG: amylo-alpha-1,6-glucosidase [Chloroflexi bacterium]|nr:amylo-alpha-1,6-glucosidase [Chloroflexota bacterium]
MPDRVLREEEVILISDELGDIPQDSLRMGLYYRDMRYLSLWEMTIGGQKPRYLASTCDQNYVGDFQLANPTLPLPNGEQALTRTISIRRRRFIAGGLHERLTFYNLNPFPATLQLALTLGSDFFDIFEVRGLERPQRGTINSPVMEGSRLLLSYQGLDRILRRTEIIFDEPPLTVEILGKDVPTTVLHRTSTFLPDALEPVTRIIPYPPWAKLTWELTLLPKTPLSLTFNIFPLEGEHASQMSDLDEVFSRLQRSYDVWHSQGTTLETDNQLFNRLLERSIFDLRLLMTDTPEGWVPIAGIPWFACPFGRDSIITSLQTLMLNPQIAVGTLRFLAKSQGIEVDHWQDEEPGRILHETRQGEMANLKEIPQALYYGSLDSTPLFLWLFAETMKWLDDDELFHELLPAAERALEWIERYGDLDGDGYLEYLTRSPRGIKHQGWKDSRDSINYPNGSPVEPPVAPVEVQGYAYKAMQEMSLLLRRKGYTALADDISQRAATLKVNFNRDFWVEEIRFYAQALDSQKRPVVAISSNPGHCLLTDIIARERTPDLVAGLMASDMLSGWGIRTLSSRAPKYNPMSYHNGSVWPHDNSLIVAGMKECGFQTQAEEIITQLFEASNTFPSSRLPELYCGFGRSEGTYSVPAEYPVSTSPQAWAAGSAILILQAILGLRVNAAAGRLYLKPRLPAFLRNISVKNLRIGRGTVDLECERHQDHTNFEITKNDARVELVIPPS